MLRSKTQVFFYALFFCAFATLVQSCKKDDDDSPNPSSYPKSVSIQYKVSSASGFTQALQLQYTNESGGIASMTNEPLPFTKTITKTVNRYDVLILSFGAVGAGELKGEILVNGTVAVTKSFTGTSSSSTVPGQVTYTFQ